MLLRLVNLNPLVSLIRGYRKQTKTDFYENLILILILKYYVVNDKTYRMLYE